MPRIFSPALKLAKISSYAGTDKILSTSKTFHLNTQKIKQIVNYAVTLPEYFVRHLAYMQELVINLVTFIIIKIYLL